MDNDIPLDVSEATRVALREGWSRARQLESTRPGVVSAFRKQAANLIEQDRLLRTAGGGRTRSRSRAPEPAALEDTPMPVVPPPAAPEQPPPSDGPPPAAAPPPAALSDEQIPLTDELLQICLVLVPRSCLASCTLACRQMARLVAGDAMRTPATPALWRVRLQEEHCGALACPLANAVRE